MTASSNRAPSHEWVARHVIRLWLAENYNASRRRFPTDPYLRSEQSICLHVCTLRGCGLTSHLNAFHACLAIARREAHDQELTHACHGHHAARLLHQLPVKRPDAILRRGASAFD